MSYIKQLVTIELLYDDEIILCPESLTLAELEHEFTDGSMSADVCYDKPKELTKKQMAKALEKQGSDPSFLISDD